MHTFIDLFCGVGGMRLAFERCGARCLWAFEPDHAARRTYWENFGDAPAGDLSTVDPPKLPDADILCATLRVGRGVRAGNRSAQCAFDRTIEILAIRQPRALLLAYPETPHAAAGGGSLDGAVRGLTDLGYYVYRGALDARSFGLPQDARCLFLAGFDRNAKFAFPKGRTRAPNISDLLDRSVPEKYYLSDQRREDLIDRAAMSAARDKDWSFRFMQNATANALTGKPDAIYQNILVDGEGKWRTLTEREWARLMGYPDSFILPPKQGKAHQLIGGSVPIPCAAAAAKRMLAALPGIGCRPTHVARAGSETGLGSGDGTGSTADDKRARRFQPDAAPRRPSHGGRNGDGFGLPPVHSSGEASFRSSRPSPLRYYGGKAIIAGKIVELLAPHNCFVDVFGGAANILLAKPPGPGIEVFNDIDQSLVNFWRVVRNPKTREELVELVEFTPYSRRVFKECIDEMAAGDRSDPVRWAWAFYVTSNQGRNGWGVRESFWAYGKSDSNANASSWARLPERLACAGRRLKTVQIENLEWEDCIRRYDAAPDTLFVMDPPYHSQARASPKVFAFEMKGADHERLLKIACKLKGKALICGYRHEMYDRMLKDWARVELSSKSYASPRNRARLQERTEVFWMNYTPPAHYSGRA